ncbi:Hypothetical protein LUCI_3429 [Lucifera butyrica]|uniref:Mg chelatase-related protein C-terminal domain-containing protein n=2 Tax=Lucifera butyrica TaxID=1351585 RepID=A0A498R9F5_9FIRM|nr:Hypothetical protein LUCI_3429 [Lucifera butyrica]
MDRIDIHVHVPRLEYSEMVSNQTAESSVVIRRRVEEARAVQYRRLSSCGLYCNSQMGHKQLKNICAMTRDAQNLMRQAFTKMNLSARGYDRIVKVARAIADLAGSEKINGQHIAEAIHFRNNLRMV